MYILTLTDKKTGLRKTIQVNTHKFLTDKAQNLLNDLSWDGMLHCIPSSYLHKKVASKYMIWGRIGVAKRIGDVQSYVRSRSQDYSVVVKNSIGLILYLGRFKDMPAYLSDSVYIQSVKTSDCYIFWVR